METSPAALPWLHRYPAGVAWDMPIPPETLVQVFDRAVAEHAARPCLDFLGARTSYGELAAQVARLEAAWGGARREYGARGGGPFLFGAFCAADAMFAPVAFRFQTYGVALRDADAAAYVAALLQLDAMREWAAAALAEGDVIAHYDAAALAAGAELVPAAAAGAVLAPTSASA